jgi:ribonuclease Z
MKVIPLGTSSGKPTASRNVSALALVREAEWILFDCGEAAQHQIMRAGLQTGRLSAVCITHFHGDHINGLAGLLATMGLDGRTRKLVIAGPVGLEEYLETLKRLKVMFVPYELDLVEVGPSTFSAGTASAPKPHPVYETASHIVSCLPLDHRIFAVGYRVEERKRPGRFDVERARRLGVPEGPLFGRLQSGHSVTLSDGSTVHPSEVLGPERRGRKIAYCTDTRPCESAVALARGVDLLIHEATYSEELIDDARQNGHSTAAQAARIARDAGADRLLITHFSARYADVSPLLEESCAVFPNTIVAQELVGVTITAHE